MHVCADHFRWIGLWDLHNSVFLDTVTCFNKNIVDYDCRISVARPSDSQRATFYLLSKTGGCGSFEIALSRDRTKYRGKMADAEVSRKFRAMFP
jgi:hypothetical protein